MKNICIIGATGSVGTQTMDVLRREKGKFNLIAISANSNYNKVIEIIEEFNPKYVVMSEKNAFNIIEDYIVSNNKKITLLYGIEGMEKIAQLDEVEIVVTSVVGMIGLTPTMKAIEAKKDIALANKETLVVAGELVMEAAKKNGVKILPVDSEHSAIFQSIQGNQLKSIKNIILTASGGPFRGKKINELTGITPNEALKHPNWSMGKKISIDSATLMNKGLEVIEAKWLFDVDYNQVKVVVHPQSVVHSGVEYVDGSVIAQMGTPDMRLPIQYALNYPNREDQIAESLDFYKMGQLNFEEPDIETFKCLKLAFKAGEIGKLMPTILNGANEACVDLFLNKSIGFLQIGDIIEEAMNRFDYDQELTLENIIRLDKEVRDYIYKSYK
ncbi:1-deoxy-D-xylulose-5-phosphate reductoisomerase [Clostridium frigidicarnis]|uniref:1-deoxy-D-xylulose 5-phosphate reductoisomerase n=1 Tax=Clostridium frigidicarnis TaxID=84698 RepID=A0A1I0WMK5_9CLOT|nr:1-deoxy-D-xylulose-5-phosphate reductoisomerase [Clostridium frigidicarnis]SFA89784.1 1-deoxy-D-xylulose 5-phosphate reductoisomerase [Clostridium frigidicarnis]